MRILLSCIVAIGVCAGLIVPAAAYAEEGYFVAKSKFPVEFKDTVTKSVDLLKDGEDIVTCGQTEAEGKLAESSHTLTVNPSYSKCVAEIGGLKTAAIVTPGTCAYIYSGLEETKETVQGSLTIGTKKCGSITIKDAAFKCSFEIPAQEVHGSAVFKEDSKTGELESSDEGKELTGKGTCPGGEALHPIPLFVVRLGTRLALELAVSRFTFNPNAVNIPRNTETNVELKNLNILSLIYQSDSLTAGWSINRGSCLGFYLPLRSCTVRLRAPNAASVGTYEVKGWVLGRGSISLTST